MTNEEISVRMQFSAEQFIETATAELGGASVDEIKATMLGCIGGAISVLLANGIPAENTVAAINSMLADMTLGAKH